jgi:hypothetical protein
LHSEWASVEDVGVDLGGADVSVAEQFLDGADIGAALEEVGGEAVAEGVAARVLGEACSADGSGNGALNDGLVDVVPIAMARRGFDVGPAGGEQPLPCEFA